MMSTGRILLGVAAGVAIGMLFAPEKGEKLRSRIAKGSKDMADKVSDQYGEVVQNVQGTIENARKGAEQWMDKGKEAYNEAKKDVKMGADHLAEKGKEAYNEMRHDGKVATTKS
jgi:gas vesicle protein